MGRSVDYPPLRLEVLPEFLAAVRAQFGDEPAVTDALVPLAVQHGLLKVPRTLSTWRARKALNRGLWSARWAAAGDWKLMLTAPPGDVTPDRAHLRNWWVVVPIKATRRR